MRTLLALASCLIDANWSEILRGSRCQSDVPCHRTLKKSRFTNEQIALAVKQANVGVPVEEVWRKLGISQQTFYRWKKRFAGLGVGEIRRLKRLEEESKKLKQLVADLSLDKQVMQDVLSKKL